MVAVRSFRNNIFWSWPWELDIIISHFSFLIVIYKDPFRVQLLLNCHWLLQKGEKLKLRIRSSVITKKLTLLFVTCDVSSTFFFVLLFARGWAADAPFDGMIGAEGSSPAKSKSVNGKFIFYVEVVKIDHDDENVSKVINHLCQLGSLQFGHTLPIP